MNITDKVNSAADAETEKIHQELIQIERRILVMRIVSYALMFLFGAVTGTLVTLAIHRP